MFLASLFVAPDVAARMIAALPLGDRALRATAFLSGLRAGELAALQVEDVELYEQGHWGVLHVRESWDKVEGRIDPKSAAGTRTVPIPPQLYLLLDEHLLRLGRSAGLIFGRSASEPFSYNAVRERAERVWKKAKLEPCDLGLHESRHSFSSWLAAAGVPRERRDRYLGHADHSMDGRYTHALDHQLLDDATMLGDYLRRADTPSRTGAHDWARTPGNRTVERKMNGLENR